MRGNKTVGLLGETEDKIEMIGLGEFARRMSVCPNTVRNWIANGKLEDGVHYLHEGHIYRFPWSPFFIAQLMRSFSPAPSPPLPKMQSRTANRARLHYRA